MQRVHLNRNFRVPEVEVEDADGFNLCSKISDVGPVPDSNNLSRTARQNSGDHKTKSYAVYQETLMKNSTPQRKYKWHQECVCALCWRKNYNRRSFRYLKIQPRRKYNQNFKRGTRKPTPYRKANTLNWLQCGDIM